MRPSQMTGIALAAFFSATTLAAAQTPPTQPPPTQPPPTQTPTQTEPAQAKSTVAGPSQTFTGCLMTERDYRAAHNLGAGQVGGVGLGDEYVLVDAKVSEAKSTDAAAPAATPAATTQPSAEAASKCADKGMAYRLTGSDEEQLRTLVGRHVEIQGRFKNADEATAGAKPEGTLPPEVEMTSFREAPAPATAEATTKAPASPPIAPPPAAAPPPPPTQPTPQTQPAQPRTEPTPQTAPATTRRELPQTASSTFLLGAIGALALSAGLVLTIVRRRIF